jgi:hypothetical protein
MSSLTVQSKVPVVIRDDYVMYLEFFDNYLWFHTDILKWTADVKKRYKEDLSKLEDLVSVPLMALIKEDNHKLTKFAKTFNWQSKGQIMLNDGSKGFIYASVRNTGE